ncbi:hypothetical protein MLD38_022992 [Melastoma candidum]|uniref:Uncharacterized protein n=1 Tax=Melastoma candidum TaxID=119954 RepID=A0ACB9QKZ7_9MYRT|nr:hypothetical protein MLD38_022992 [Melastoma candidum]
MGRSPCCEKAHTNKGAWTKEEDDKLVAYIRAHGEGCWRSLPKAAGLLRCGKSCRLRWINYLRPDLKRGNFTEEEDEVIIKLHSLLGNKWSLIAARLPGRTDNEIKNYWNTHIRRKLLNRGIDPSTHRPIHDSPLSTTTTIPPTSHDPTTLQNPPPPPTNTTTTTTISFAPSKKPENIPDMAENVTIEFGNGKQEEFPDLNLELSISLPSHGEKISTSSSSSTLTSTSSILRNGRGKLACGNENKGGSECGSGGVVVVGYDFLGLKQGMLDSTS